MMNPNQNQSMNQNQLMNQNRNNEKSLTIDLENLRKKYKNQLIQYKLAVSNYVNYLNDQTKLPCGNFTANSKGIDQGCYEYIWKKSGCGSGTVFPDANNSWAKGQTLNGLIQDSWRWSTMTDYNHRMGCYGQPGNPYIIIGVGADGNLWSRQGLDAPWKKINDDSNGNIRSICTGNDGKTIIATNLVNNLDYKPSWDNSKWQGGVQNPCCIMSVAQGQNGTIVGVGMDNKLWSKPDLNGNWTQTADPGEWISAIAIAPDGSIFCVGGSGYIWKKNSYLNLQTQGWEFLGNNSCCVKAITIAPDGTFIGIGTDNQIYTKPNYKDLSGSWSGPYNTYNSSCCVVSITTVVNPNYNSSVFSSSSAPNFKINNEPYVSLQGRAFNGTGSAGQSEATTLQDCEASCANLSNCSGATFVSNKCLIRTGDSPIVASSNDSYAIIPKSKQLLLNMEDINQQLIETNNQIINKINSLKPVYVANNQESSNKTRELMDNYKNLVLERDNILKLLNDYNTLDSVENENEIKITKNYYSYILLSILAIAIIFLLYKVSIPTTASASAIPTSTTTSTFNTSKGQLGFNTYYILFAIILITIAIHFYSKYYVYGINYYLKFLINQ